MPPKKKDIASSPVYSMPHEKQVQLLSDALLREYMHRRGFLSTLKAFDAENARDEETISSRALMSDLMSLPPDAQSRLKSEGIETIMEMLCALRVERRQEVERLTREANASVPEVPEEYVRVAEKQKRRMEKREKHAAGGHSGGSREVKKSKLRNRSKKSVRKQSLSDEDIPAGLTIDDLLGSSSTESDGQAGLLGSERPQQTGSSGPNLHEESTEEREDGKSEADADDEEEEHEPSLDGGVPVGEEAAHAIHRVLLGHAPAPPPSFTEQGFIFDTQIEYALTQWRRGPGAVLAVVQAFFCVFFYEKDMYVGLETRRRRCLVRTLSTILSKAQPNSSCIVLVDGKLHKAHPLRGFERRLATHFYKWDGFTDTKEVDEYLDQLLECSWMQPQGTGILCFLLSLVLSRGPDVIESDMDPSRSRVLIKEATGEGTQELANLCLCGRAVSFTHDGTVKLNGEVRRGYDSSLLCGILQGEWGQEDTFMDSATYAHATIPKYPSWVIQYRNHYVNLFMKKDARKLFQQKRDLGGDASVDFTYWDASTQEDDVQLTATVSALSWGDKRRQLHGFVHKAITQVPDWAGATIDWHGSPPIRN